MRLVFSARLNQEHAAALAETQRAGIETRPHKQGLGGEKMERAPFVIDQTVSIAAWIPLSRQTAARRRGSGGKKG